jgi:hypothetical protein
MTLQQNVIVRTSAVAAAWLEAIVSATGGELSPVNDAEGDDCAEIVRHFAEAGVTIRIEQANAFWLAYSATLCAGWLGLPVSSVAALDGLVEEIEKGWCQDARLNALKGTVRSMV